MKTDPWLQKGGAWHSASVKESPASTTCPTTLGSGDVSLAFILLRNQELPAAGRQRNDLVSGLLMPQSGRTVVHLRKR